MLQKKCTKECTSYEIYSFTGDAICRVSLPPVLRPTPAYHYWVSSEVRKKNHLIETNGWILRQSCERERILIHPFSRHVIPLPNTTDWEEVLWYVSKGVLSSSPSLSLDDYVLMIIYNCSYCLAFWKPGDQTWTMIKTHAYEYKDIIYCRGQFYAVNNRGEIFVCDVGGCNPTEIVSICRIPVKPVSDSTEFYLAAKTDNHSMFLVVGRDKECNTEGLDSRYSVYEVDLGGEGVWEKVNDLGNKTIFVSKYRESVCVEHSKFPPGIIEIDDIHFKGVCWHMSLRTDCIHCKDEPRYKKGICMRIHNLKDRNVQNFFHSVDSWSVLPLASTKSKKDDPPKQRVMLSPSDCSMDFDIEGDGLRGSALHHEDFAYCWSGARANIGIIGGKYCFSCRIVENQKVAMDDTPPNQQNLCDIGISRVDNDVGNIGETHHNFGFGDTGTFYNSGNKVNYGEIFGEGDTIMCAVDLEIKPASIRFFKNGKSFCRAISFDAGDGESLDCALFPHVLLKNVIVEMKFSLEDGLFPIEGYKPWSSAIGDENGVHGPSFSDPTECEVMIVGLPASGMTSWAAKILKDHPEKHYTLLGTSTFIDQMKIPGLPKVEYYAERNNKFITRAQGILSAILPRVAKRPRNYIIERSNAYKGARIRQMELFANYKKVAVVVFQTTVELNSHADKTIKATAKSNTYTPRIIYDLLGKHVLPESRDWLKTDDIFDEVIFSELDREEAQRSLDEIESTQLSPASVSPHPRASPLAFSGSSQSPYFPMPPPLSPLPLNYHYQRTGQVNPAYLGSAPQNRMGSFPVVSLTPILLSAPYFYNYPHGINNSTGSVGVAPVVSTHPYSGYILHGTYGSYQSPMIRPYVTPSYYGDNISQYEAPRGLSMYAPPPPISYGSSPYAATPVPTPTYGNDPVPPRPNNAGQFHLPEQRRYI